MKAIVTEEMEITEAEKVLIEQFRVADEDIKQAIIAILKVEEER